MKIPFNKPFIVGKELFYIAQAVLNGHISGDGPFTKKCQKLMEEKFSAKKVLLTHSCTAALEMSALLINIQPGDEVILPSYTFVSTANAFALRGAKLIFVDIRKDTLNIDETLIEPLITKKTKAIVAVHYAGVACEMETIMNIANRYKIYVIEDAAQGVNASYKGKFLGTLGHLGCYSFHETKNFISGEGGALVVNDNDFIDRAEIIREKGTNRSQFLNGETDKYTWIDIGSSYLPSDIIAAFLYAQLEFVDFITRRRQDMFEYYGREFSPLEQKGSLRLPFIPDSCQPNGHLSYIICKSKKERDSLLTFLNEKGVGSVFHYIPLHSSPRGKIYGKPNNLLPVTDRISSCIIRLPCYFSMSKSELQKVVDIINLFFDVH